MAYATESELEARLGFDVESSRASALLDDATAIIDDYVGGSLLQASTTDERLPSPGRASLFLPGPPTTAVASVQVSSEVDELPSSAYRLDTAKNRLMRIDGGIWPPTWVPRPYLDATWWNTIEPNEIIIARTSGFTAPLPNELVAITCALAGRLLLSATSSGGPITGESLGDHSISYGSSSAENPRDLLSSEMAVLDKWSYSAGSPYSRA